MTDDLPFRVDGFIPDEDDPKHWDFQTGLMSRMTMTAGASADVDLREFTSPRHNQGRTGSCVAQSVIKALEIKRIMKYGHDKHVDLSIMALYYLARQLMSPLNTEYDKGTFISLACDALRRFGVCPTDAWPWDTDKLFTPPSWKAMRHAYMGRIESFYRIRGGNQAELVADCLRAGNPVVFGTNTSSQWNGYRSGVMKPVDDDDRQGRHATCIVGVEGDKFIVENSWGTGWGDNGFYYVDCEFLNHSSSRSFWVIQAGFEEYVG